MINQSSEESVTYKKEQLLRIIFEDLNRLIKKVKHYSECDINEISQDDIIAMYFDGEQLLVNIKQLNEVIAENKILKNALKEIYNIDEKCQEIDKYLFAKFLESLDTEID